MAEIDANGAAAPGFDPDVLRGKYRQERDKRLRSDGNEQYIEARGHFAGYTEDPYVTPGFTREPVDREVEVAIVGGGFSGMLAAVRLRERGVTDIVILEKGGDFGGTWYWNRYPGAQCDIDAYCYLPLLEETGYIPKEKYSYAEEIYAHSKRIGETYDLYSIALFQTGVDALRWEESSRSWRLETSRGDRIKARFVIMAQGPVGNGKLPGIPGIETFKGHSFHTSRWDYDYTGGNAKGNLHRLADKRVAVIGTGATAIQCIPYVGKHAKQLYVFQRTPSSVDERGNTPTDPDWAAALQTGWQRERRENFNDIVVGNPFTVDLVADRWTDIFNRLMVSGFGKTLSGPEALQQMEWVDFEKMNEIRGRVDSIVADPATAEALKPWYRQFCKRPTFNDEYLPTFNLPNVTLVDVSISKGVERITENGLVANGKLYEVDCIIYATGFEISTSLKRRLAIDVTGSNDISIHDHWAQRVKTLHGFTTTGFPNWFFMGVSQNGLSVNMTSMFDEQAQHIAYLIDEAGKRQVTRLEPTPEAQAQWDSFIRGMGQTNRDFAESCTPGYYNGEGRRPAVPQLEPFAGSINKFHALLADWREQGDMAGLNLE